MNKYGTIKLCGVSKLFKTFSRRPGLRGAVLDLFRREYYTVTALDRISLTINPAEIVGYLGPNGAGKSTTLKIMAGVLLPTEGQVEVNGFNPWTQRHEHARYIGVLFGQRSQLAWNLPVIESFRFLKEIYSIPESEYRTRLEEMIETLELKPLLYLPVRELSLGQRTRCELAAVLLHNPSVLLLDEPTIGLDVEVKLKIRAFLKKINSCYRTTIIVASHDLHDVEGLADRVVVLDKGRLVFDGSLESLRRDYSPYFKRVLLRFKDEENLRQAQHQLGELKASYGGLTQSGDGLSVSVTLYQELKVQQILDTIPQEGLTDLVIEDPRIEDVVLEIYRRRHEDAQVRSDHLAALERGAHI